MRQDVFIALSSRRWEYHVGSLYFSAAQILQHALSFLKVFGYYTLKLQSHSTCRMVIFPLLSLANCNNDPFLPDAEADQANHA